MKFPTTQELLGRIDRYLYDPRLDAEALLRKRWTWIWVVATFMGVIISLIMFLGFLNFWPLWWGALPLMIGYTVIFLFYRKTLRFDLLVNVSFSVYIIAFFLIMVKAGGFPSSLGFIVAGLNCAMASVLTGNRNWTIGMFSLYLLTIVLLGILQPYLETPDFITLRKNTIASVVQIAWITACTLLLMMLFVRDQRRFQKAEAERMRKIDEAKTLLYTNVSHEFRTPLTLIQGMAEQLEKHPEKWMGKGPAKIKEQSRVLLRLVNQMLDIARIEADEMKLDLIHGDLIRFVRYVTESFKGLAEYRNLDLELRTPESAIMTDYDPEKLMQVFTNLISNAIKFTPSGGSVMVEVTALNQNSEDNIQIKVSDTGRGIPGESLERVFDRFYQVPDRTVETPGTGLGLAVTSELVRLMEGEITVESIPAKNTTFTITLPKRKKAPAAKDHGITGIHPGTVQAIFQDEDPQSESMTDQKHREEFPILLIVEDNTDVQEYVASILHNGYRIERANNGKEGLEKAIDIIPDIILTDVMMPVMDGFELLNRIREDHRTNHIPVVVLTARGDPDSKLTGLETGADQYLVKPFSEQELKLKLRNLLEARQKMQKMLANLQNVVVQEDTPYPQEQQFIDKVNTLLEEQLSNEEFGIVELCQALYMSRPQFYRKFTAITNRPIGKYIRSFRLHKAKEMLEKYGKNVSEAAMDSGFKNLSHFSAVFREEFGITPREALQHH